MYAVAIEDWSRRASIVHDRDARVKIVLVLVFLVALATTPAPILLPATGYGVLLAAAIVMARLPILGLLGRAALVLPFSATFALVSLVAGDRERALLLLVKSCLSAVAVVILVATTPMPSLLYGAERLGAPRMVVLVIQFLYRYLFVIGSEAHRMRQASSCRAPKRQARGTLRNRFRAASGMLAVLFGRSYQRAEAIHRAMLARGFTGRFHILSPPALRAYDLAFLVTAAALLAGVRIWAGI